MRPVGVVPGRRAPRRRAPSGPRAAPPPGPPAGPAGPARAPPAPPCRRRRRIRAAPRRTRRWLSASTPAVGSSSTSSSGSVASARAIIARCCCPPERVATGSPARSASPTAAIARATAARSPAPQRRRRSRRRASRPELTSSVTVAGTPLPAPSRWGTYPIRSAVPEPRQRGAEQADTAAGQRQQSEQGRSRVDLPEPLAPRMATTSPRCDPQRDPVQHRPVVVAGDRPVHLDDRCAHRHGLGDHGNGGDAHEHSNADRSAARLARMRAK